MNWNLTLDDFEKIEYGTPEEPGHFLEFDDCIYTRIQIGRTVFGTQWAVKIFHKGATIEQPHRSRKACLESIPKLMRAFK